MLQEAVNTVLQVVIVSLFASLAWGASWLIGRRKLGFFEYVGLFGAPWRSLHLSILCTLIVGGASLALFKCTALNEIATGSGSVVGRIRAMGWSAETFAVVALVALVKTAFCEELLFRGVLAKRLIAWWGFGFGNFAQALAFGAVHLLVFLAPGGPGWDLPAAAALVGVTGAGGWMMGWLNERAGAGSIAPSWLMHGAANFVSYPVLAFL